MHFADLSHELGRNARGLYVLASAYAVNGLVEGCTAFLPFVSEKKLKAEVLDKIHASEKEIVYILKPGFWMGMVRNDYEIGLGSIVVASDNRALCENGIDVLIKESGIARKLNFSEDGKFKGYLIDSAIEMIINAPKRRIMKIAVIGEPLYSGEDVAP